MSDITDKAAKVTAAVYGRSVIPFTGLFFAVWAFFGPASYGHWLGTIVRAFIDAASAGH